MKILAILLQMVTEGSCDKEEGHIAEVWRWEQRTICSVPEIRRRSGNPSHSHLQSSYLGNKIRTWRAWQCRDTWSIAEDCRWEQTEAGIRGQMDTPGCSHLKLSYPWRRAWSCIVRVALYDIFKNPEDRKRRQYLCKPSLPIFSLLFSSSACYGQVPGHTWCHSGAARTEISDHSGPRGSADLQTVEHRGRRMPCLFRLIILSVDSMWLIWNSH